MMTVYLGFVAPREHVPLLTFKHVRPSREAVLKLHYNN